MSKRDVVVSADLDGTVRRVGVLHFGSARGREIASFAYESEWLASPDRFPLAPALALGAGSFQPTASQTLHAPLTDSAPDRWGRTLMRREERRRARTEGRTLRALSESDFLLGVTDRVRQGALRFQLDASGPFLAEEASASIPPLVELPRLLAAVRDLETDEDEASDDALALLLAPGSSLGGARPKASVIDTSGSLWIAKFPQSDDEYSTEVWEAVVLTLARSAGILVEEFSLREVAGTPVLLVKRFDRRGAIRIPYLSAMSLLNAADGEARSYVEIAESLRQHGTAAKSDLAELWRRLVFTIRVANLDDHLRNHGFLLAGPTGWRLSPVFDLNPVPADVRARYLSTAIDIDGDPTASVEKALVVHGQFQLSLDDSRMILGEVDAAVRGWERVAREHGARRGEIARMESAFRAD